MKRALIGAALLALAACGPSEPAKKAAPPPAPAPTNLNDLSLTLGPGELAQLVIRQVKEAPGGPRGCDQVWDQQDMGVVPDDALTGSVFAAHVGARAFSIHCDALGAQQQTDGTGQWLVFLPPDSMAGVVEPCVARPRAENICFKNIPRNP